MSAFVARWRCVWLGVLTLLALAQPASAHPLDVASLSLKEETEGRFAMTWHAGSSSLQEDVQTPAQFPPACRAAADHVDCGATGLVGVLEFPWLESTSRRLLVDIQWLDGSRTVRAASASTPRLYVARSDSRSFAALAPIGLDYGKLGVTHVLSGLDHLLFVVALTLLVRRARVLLATVTAFTLAHSLSLAATVLGLIQLPVAPVEASIALSVVLVCAECLRPEATLSRRAPWLIAFAFGLLHGCGFASALQEVGLPVGQLPLALGCFNLGVELGQLAVVSAVLLLERVVRRLPWRARWPRLSLLYAMGSVAGAWSIERALAIFTP
jgi:hydrogenase/urease accessory protein HupE